MLIAEAQIQSLPSICSRVTGDTSQALHAQAARCTLCTTISAISQVLPSQKGECASPAGLNSTETPHTPPSQPRHLPQPTRNLCPGPCDSSRNRSCSPTAESPPKLWDNQAQRGVQEGFANTAPLLRHYWHIPTYGQSWKQGGGVTII